MAIALAAQEFFAWQKPLTVLSLLTTQEHPK
jgi:hypothetical protein